MSGLQLVVLQNQGNGIFAAGEKTFNLSNLDSVTQQRVATAIDYAYQTAQTNAFVSAYLSLIGSSGNTNTIQFFSDPTAMLNAEIAAGVPNATMPPYSLAGVGGYTASTPQGIFIFINPEVNGPGLTSPYSEVANATIHELLHTDGPPGQTLQHYSATPPGMDPSLGAAPYWEGLFPDVMNVLSASLSQYTNNQFYDPVTGATNSWDFGTWDLQKSQPNTMFPQNSPNVPGLIFQTPFNTSTVQITTATQEEILYNPDGSVRASVILNTQDPTANYTYTVNDPSIGVKTAVYEVGAAGVLTEEIDDNRNGTSTVILITPSISATPNETVQNWSGDIVQTPAGPQPSGYILNSRTNYSDGSSDFTDYVNGIEIVTSSYGATFVTATSQIGSSIVGAFGSSLGNILGGGNTLASLVLGSALSGVGETIGEVAQAWFDSNSIATISFTGVVNGGLVGLPTNVETSSLSEVAGYLFGQLVNDLGIKGEAGGLVDAIGGTFSSVFAQNVVRVANGVQNAGYFDGLSGTNFEENLASSVGAYLGSQLATAVVSPTTDGGQFGEQIGSALGGVGATIAIANGIGASVVAELGGDFLAYVTVGAALGFVGAFVGAVVGTLIGDLFGEAPSPQAYADINVGQSINGHYFTDVFRSSKDGGPTSTVMSIASAITSELNAAIAATGGTLGNASSGLGSVVGIRQGVAEDVDSTGDHKFYGSQGVKDLINYAVLTDLARLVIVGGDVYIKRALEMTATGAVNSDGTTTIDTNAIAGDIKIAQDYEKYLSDETDINAVIASVPQSAFAIGWAAELAEAAALGLDARGVNDWNAGWNGFLQAQNVDPTQVTFAYGGTERLITANGTVVHDTIDSTDKTIIQGSTTGGQTIALDGSTLLTPSTGTISFNGTLVAAASGGTLTATADTVPIAAMIYAGYTGTTAGDTIFAGSQGNDVFGGNGGDLIYGFSAIPTTGSVTSISTTPSVADATWIWGGTGNDTIIAGISSGDYLNGGAGNDSINAGATNSAWLDGGTGNNTLIGGTGDDVITAEGGSSTALYSDIMTGGGGTDTYVVDPYTKDTINNAPASGQAPGGGTIELGSDIAFSQVGMSTVSGTGTNSNLVIKIYAAGTAGSTVPGGYTQVDASNSVIETITVQNWSVLADRVQYLESYDPQTNTSQTIDLGNFTKITVGTPGSDFLEGSQGSDGLFGMGGTDTIEGFGSNDLINGDGFLDGGTGNDTIFGGSQADTLLGGPGSNVLEGAGGNDLILGAAFNAGANTIQGGPGNDTVIGGSNSNLFEYAAGDGSDLLISSLNTAISTSTTSTTHTVSFTAGWIPVWLSSSTFQSDFARDTVSGEITLTNPTVVDGQTLSAGTPIYYTQQTTVGGAVIQAGTMNGIVDVEDGISTLTGISDSGIYWQPFINQSTMTQTVSNPNDTLEFGPSITQSELLFLHPAGSNDLLIGINDGNLTSSATPGSFAELSDEIRIENYFSTGAIGEISFESASGSITVVKLPTVALLGPSIDGGAQLVSVSNTATTQAYWITGAAPNDTLTSGAGDTLVGGAGNDTIVGGAGSNLLIGNAGNDSLVAGSSGIDTLDGGPGADTLVGSGQTWASYADDTVGLTVNLGNPTGVLQPSALTRAHMQFAGFRYGDVAQFLFGLNVFEMGFGGAGPRLTGPPTVNANTGDAVGDVYDNITGVIGSKYNDTLVAAATGSSLDGGGGSDLLIGGTGNDDFIYNVASAAAYGSDTIELLGGSDTLDIYDIGGPGVTFDNVGFASSNGTLSSSNGTLVLTDGAAHTITIVGLTSTGQTLTLNLDGDTSVTFSGIPVSGNSGFAVASSPGGSVQGGAAPTMIVGGSGNNVLIGESGNDTFEGGLGADTITGASNASGTTINTASYAGSSAGVTITLNNGAATGIGGDAQGDVLTNIQNLVGSAGNDSLSALGTNSEIDGGTGNDTIYGSGGNDTLIGNGVDSITSGTGNMLISVANCTIAGTGSTLAGGAGNDTIYGGAGNDIITDTGYAVSNGTTTVLSSSLNGGLGNDYIASYGNDTADGGGGQDTIISGSGNSLLEDSGSNAVIVGGPGSDTLFAGAGNNTLLGGLTTNTVLISDQASDGGTSGSNTINGSDVNYLYGSGLTWSQASPTSQGTFTWVAPPPLLAGNDTFELSSQSGTTVIEANYGVNELEFDTSVNYQNLVFEVEPSTPSQLDVLDSVDGQNFEIEIQNFFNGNMSDPSIRDATNDGYVMFFSQLANSSSSTWTANGVSGTGTLNWQPAVSATDTISGSTTKANILVGSKYNNVITSDDTVVGNIDQLIAGGGSNTITGGAASASIIGGSVSDSIIGGGASNWIVGGSGTETIFCGVSSVSGAVDSITAGSGAETIQGGGGTATNVIIAGSGSDYITGGSGNNTITGGSGPDTITGGAGTNVIYGGSGAETIYGATLTGGQFVGATTINAGSGSEVIYTYTGATSIYGGTGADTITTGTGIDFIQLAAGDASVNAASGMDTIDLTHTQATTADTIQAGDDLVLFGLGEDTLSGTQLTTVSFATFTAGVTVNAQTGASGGAVAGDSITGVGTIIGTSFADNLTTSNDAQASVYGGGGNDTLYAGTGNDTLENGLTSAGVAGNDMMYGDTSAGSGNDTFYIDGGNNVIDGGVNDDDYFISGGGSDTINQASRTGTVLLQDAITLDPGAAGALTIVGPTSTGGTVGTQLAFETAAGSSGPTYALYYDLWFQKQGESLVITELGANGPQETVTLSGWFTNSTLQANLADQLFDVGLVNNTTKTYSLLTQLPLGNNTNGLLVPALVSLDGTYTMPVNAAAALALFNAKGVNSYGAQLQDLWLQNVAPTLTIVGSNTGTILEEIPTSTGNSSLTFQVQVSDEQTKAQNLTIIASNVDGASDGIVSVGTINASGVANITLTFNQGLQNNGGQDFVTGNIPISLTVEDAIGAISTYQTFTASVILQDPPPSLLGVPASISMNEGATATTNGASSTYSFSVYDLTPQDVVDSGSVTLTASSSNTAVIPNGDIELTNEGSGTYALALLSPAGVFGSSNITLSAYDGTFTTTQVIPVTVNEVAVAPVLSGTTSLSYDESAASETLDIGITVSSSNGVTPSVSVTDPQSPSGWGSPTIIFGTSGKDTIQLIVNPYTYSSGNLVVTATANYGSSLGTKTTTETVSVQGIFEHLPFTVPTSQTFTVAENSGVSVLTGFGSIGPIGDSNGDAFTYTILNGNSAGLWPTDGGAIGVASATGLVYDNGISWSPSGGNSYKFGVQVSNGVYSYTDTATVNVTDNSPPNLTFSGEIDEDDNGNIDSEEILIYASDPHGLTISTAITSQSEKGNLFTLSPTSNMANDPYPEGVTDVIFVYPEDLNSTTVTINLQVSNTQHLSSDYQVTFSPGDDFGSTLYVTDSSAVKGSLSKHIPVIMHNSTPASATRNMSEEIGGQAERLIAAIASFSSTSTGLAFEHGATIAAHELSAGFIAASSHPAALR